VRSGHVSHVQNIGIVFGGKEDEFPFTPYYRFWNYGPRHHHHLTVFIQLILISADSESHEVKLFEFPLLKVTIILHGRGKLPKPTYHLVFGL
jgi:hypothetical protein